MTSSIPPSESSTVEFKRELSASNAQLLKTVVAFANTFGGQIFIGVSDDGSPRGMDPAVVASILENLPKQIFDSVTPPVMPRVVALSVKGKQIVSVGVSPGTQMPYFLSSQGLEKGCFVRVGRSSLRAGPDMTRELEWRGRGLSPDRVLLYRASERDLDLRRFEAFLSERRGKIPKRSVPKFLREYGVLVEEHGKAYPTRGGIVCFGRDPQASMSEAYVVASHFRGVTGRDAIASVDCLGTLEDQFEAALSFVQSRLQKSFAVGESPRRKERLELPLVALREIILNALVHRDYSIPACGKVAIYDNRVEIFSPGQFPGPFEPADLGSGVSYIRNPIIARVMRELGYIEKLGSGYPAIYEACREAGVAAPEVVNGRGFVKVTLLRGAAQPVPGSQEVSPEKRVLQLLEHRGQIVSSEVQEDLKVSKATAARILDALIKTKKIQRRGKGRATHYVLSSR